MSTVVYVILGEFPQGVTADTISELTSGSGVTIDSVLLKDGQVDLADDKKVLLGTGDDGELYVNGDNVYIRNVTADKDIIFSVLDGAAQTTMMTLDADVPQVDFGNIAVVNVGAAGNDFGASNSLVATTLSGDIAMGGNDVTNVGTITGEASTASLILAGFTANAQHDIKIQTVNAAGDTQVDRMVFASDNDAGASSITITEPTNFSNVAVTNLGAAGNDFGASNSLVATTFSGDVAMGGNDVTNVGLISGEASAASLILAGYTANAQHDVKIQTVNAAGDTLVDRIVFGSDNDAGSSSISITEPTDFNNVSVTNVGAAGNDFGATNTLVGTTIAGALIGTPDQITTSSEGVAASLTTIATEITTDGGADLNEATLANGTVGQIKIFTIVVEGNAGDTLKITPATMAEGTQITFDGTVGQGCVMIYTTTVGWCVVGNNGGVIS